MGLPGDPYATLDELKDYLSVPSNITKDDAKMTDALAGASADIERICNRQFNLAADVSTRVFKPKTMRDCFVDDFATDEGLVVETDPGGVGDFTNLFTTADYELYPLNGLVGGTPWPYTKIRSVGGFYFPLYYGIPPYRRAAVVQVTAQWGWPAVPYSVHQACLIMAAMNAKLSTAPFGVAGFDQFKNAVNVRGSQPAADMLSRYVRRPVQLA